jgi:flagellar protein FliT
MPGNARESPRDPDMNHRDEDCVADRQPGPTGDLLDGYERVAEESRRLKRAVEQGDWDEVARTEAACRELIGAIRQLASTSPLEPGQNRRRMELLGMILADDARIRESLEPWLAELEQYLGQNRARRPDR